MVCGFGPIGMVPLSYEFCTSKDSKENKINKFEEKVKNKAKHGVATAAVAGTSIAGAALVLGHEEKKAIADGVISSAKKAENFIKKTPKISEDLINSIKNKDFKDFKYVGENIKNATKNKAEEIGKFIRKSPIDLTAKINTIKTGKKGFIGQVQQKGSKIYNLVKKSLTFGSKKLGAMFDTVANTFKTMPKNQKLALGVLAAGLTAIGLINNHSSYKNGKIDQKYEEKNAI